MPVKIGLTVKNAIMHFISNISRASRRGADQVPVGFGYLVGSRLIFEKVWIRFRIRIFKVVGSRSKSGYTETSRYKIPLKS